MDPSLPPKYVPRQHDTGAAAHADAPRSSSGPPADLDARIRAFARALQAEQSQPPLSVPNTAALDIRVSAAAAEPALQLATNTSRQADARGTEVGGSGLQPGFFRRLNAQSVQPEQTSAGMAGSWTSEQPHSAAVAASDATAASTSQLTAAPPADGAAAAGKPQRAASLQELVAARAAELRAQAQARDAASWGPAGDAKSQAQTLAAQRAASGHQPQVVIHSAAPAVSFPAGGTSFPALVEMEAARRQLGLGPPGSGGAAAASFALPPQPVATGAQQSHATAASEAAPSDAQPVISLKLGTLDGRRRRKRFHVAASDTASPPAREPQEDEQPTRVRTSGCLEAYQEPYYLAVVDLVSFEGFATFCPTGSSPSVGVNLPCFALQGSPAEAAAAPAAGSVIPVAKTRISVSPGCAHLLMLSANAVALFAV